MEFRVFAQQLWKEFFLMYHTYLTVWSLSRALISYFPISALVMKNTRNQKTCLNVVTT